MRHAQLGTLDVGPIGLGAMGMSTAFTGAGTDDAESICTLRRALDLGVTLIDTGVTRVEENTTADQVELTDRQLQRLDALAPAEGDHNEAQMAMIDR